MSKHLITEDNILDKLNQYRSYSDIQDFFEFVLKKITCRNDKLLMIELLTKMTASIDDEVQYNIITDTLDYLIGFYGSLDKNSQAYAFVEKLSKFD